jgi:putative heme-binding domain-containing protein
LELIRSKQFPDDWQGNAVTCDFRAHRVVRFGIEEQGSAFAARELTDLLRTTNVTFRPIDVKLGPDGALYVADWSNPIIQHGEVDFRDPRRDHEHGRIWRITAKGRPLVPRPALVNAANEALFEQLLSPNAFNQQQARRVLTERGLKIRSDLGKWARSLHSEKALLEALWMYQAIDVVEPRLLEKVLNSKDGRIRAAGTRVISYWHPRLKNPLSLLEARVGDEHPRVRLEAMRALAEIPSARSAALVLSAVDKPMDPFLDYGAWLSINDLAQPWLAAVKAGQWKPEGHERQLEFALKALEPRLAGAVLAQVLERREIPRDGSGPWFALIGSAGDPTLLRRLFDQTLTNGFDKAAMPSALEALAAAANQREVKPSGDLDEIGRLLTSSEEKVREKTLRLIGDWKRKKFVPQLTRIAGASSSSTNLRKAAFDSLRDIGGKEAVAALKKLSDKESDPSIRREAVLALTALDIEKGSKPAVEILLAQTDEKNATEFWRSLLSIKGAGLAIGRALPKTGLPVGMAKAGLRVAREGGRNEPDLVWTLTRGADLEEESQTLSVDELQALAKTASTEGDAARGEMIFRRKELSCVSCHAIGGVGGKVGPDLTSIGASAQMDYLVESVLYPNRKIKEGYHAIIVETKDGLDLSGVLVSENAEQLVLRDATGKEISIAKNNIENRATGKSLMPSGVVDVLTPCARLEAAAADNRYCAVWG